MKTVFKNVLFVFLVIWHCVASYFTLYFWVFGVYFIFDQTYDEYTASIIIGVFMLAVWALAYIPSCLVLSKKLYSYKKRVFMALIPITVTILIAAATYLYVYIDHMNC